MHRAVVLASRGSAAQAPVVEASRPLQPCTRHQRQIEEQIVVAVSWCVQRQFQQFQVHEAVHRDCRSSRVSAAHSRGAGCRHERSCGEVHRARSSRIRGTCACGEIHHARSSRLRGTCVCGEVHRARSSRLRGTCACGEVHHARSSRVRGTCACGEVHRARSSRVRGTCACGEVHHARSSRVCGTSASGEVHRARSGRVRWTSAVLCSCTGIQKSPHHVRGDPDLIVRLRFNRRGASTPLWGVETCSHPSRRPNPIPAIPPYVVRTPHLHGAPTTEETVKL